MAKVNINRDDLKSAEDGEVVETEWDWKRVGVGIFVLAVLFIVGSYIFFPKGSNQATLGASTQNLSPTPALPNERDVQGIINSAKQTLSQLTSNNLTSSQAAIQKVITDLQQLQGSKSAVGAFCSLVCGK